jgi:DNA-binding NarL/FixJ family response regulator
MPVMNGIEATRLIAERHLAVKVVVFSSARDVAPRAVTEAGAAAHLEKNAIYDLVTYIRAEAAQRGVRT